jgi:hypothetical protein
MTHGLRALVTNLHVGRNPTALTIGSKTNRVEIPAGLFRGRAFESGRERIETDLLNAI